MAKGHAVHFLERLERLTPADLELALGLYRDAPLVKSVLAQAALPDGDGRVAISIGREGRGPYLVVERDGAFVTCLGAGMKHDLPTVRRDELDAISKSESRLRACLKAARELTGADRASAQFITHTLRSGRWMSSERFLVLKTLSPLMGRTYLEAAHASVRQLEAVTARLHAAEPLGAKHAELLESREQLAWRMTHLLVAGVDEIKLFIKEFGADGPAYAWILCTELFSCGYVGPAFRGLWLAAQLGPSLMPYLKTVDEEPSSLSDVLYAQTAMAAIGVAHLAHRGDALKQLKRTHNWMKIAGDDPIIQTMSWARARHIDMLLDEHHPDRKPVAGHAFLKARGMTIEELGAERFNLIARSHLPNRTTVEAPPQVAVQLTRSCGWLATTPGADLNLPKAMAMNLHGVETQFDEHVAALNVTRLLRPFDGADDEPRPAPGKGRNARCACGSGKKRKRCCAATAVV